MNNFDFTNMYDAARYWKEQGLDPLPIPYVDGHPVKGPKTSGWQTRAAEGHAPEDFNDECNTGILLGGRRNVADVDADSTIAIAIAGEVLPEELPNTRRFGHGRELCAHSLYFLDESIPSEEIQDP